MAEFINDPVFPLSDTRAATYTSDAYAIDFAIAGIPFLSAAGSLTGHNQYRRETAPYRKEQFDTARDVGEQSLVYWWLKSQSSFHGGAGQKYLDTTLNDDPYQPLRFDSSLGVDIWTPGAVTLLKRTTLDSTSTAASQRLMAALDGTTPVYFHATDAALKRCTGAASAAVTWGGAATIVSLCNDGSSYYAAASDGIYKGTLGGGAGAKVWDTGSSSVVIAWAKQRLMAGIGASIYELTGTGPALPAAKYTHPNSGWKWTALADGPNAVYAAGYAGSTSAIFRFALESSGGVPTLTSGVTVAELPPGEQITSLFSYIGSVLAIGTNKGLRLAVIDAGSGNLTMGPRLFDTSLPILAIVGEDRFLYCTVSNGLGGNSGLYRVDLGLEGPAGRYAYATDLQAHVQGSVSGLGLLGERLVFCVEGAGAYLEHATDLEASGTLTTSRIRFGTVEPKLLKHVRLRSAPLVGSISAYYTDPSGEQHSLMSFSEAGAVVLPETAISAAPLEFASLTFTLARDGGNAASGPEFRSYQLKALPAAKRQRLQQVPLLCFDQEKDRSGQQMGYEGWAWQRLKALEELEEAGDVVLFQHFAPNTGISTAELVVIDGLQFIQGAAPTNASGWGGTILATLRSV